jgi:phosphogluconate dehydratase
VCGRTGQLEAVGVDLASREPAPRTAPPVGTGRELFGLMRMTCDDAEAGASAMLAAMDTELDAAPAAADHHQESLVQA